MLDGPTVGELVTGELPTLVDSPAVSTPKNPNCCQVWSFGCCRPEAKQKAISCCVKFWKHIGAVLAVVIAIAMCFFVMPWILGNAVYGASVKVYVGNSQYIEKSCWTFPSALGSQGDACFKSYGIGMAVWIMVLSFSGAAIFGLMILRKSDLCERETKKIWFWWCFVIFWLAFPPFIGAVGGFRLAMNHFPNCQYWQNDMANNIEYKCSTTDEILSSAFASGFCATGAFFCCPPAGGQCWDCSEAENLEKNKWRCANRLREQCDHCKGVGWVAIGLPLMFLPLVILLLVFIGGSFYECGRIGYEKYQKWKAELVKQQAEAAQVTLRRNAQNDIEIAAASRQQREDEISISDFKGNTASESQVAASEVELIQ